MAFRFSAGMYFLLKNAASLWWHSTGLGAWWRMTSYKGIMLRFQQKTLRTANRLGTKKAPLLHASRREGWDGSRKGGTSWLRSTRIRVDMMVHPIANLSRMRESKDICMFSGQGFRIGVYCKFLNLLNVGVGMVERLEVGFVWENDWMYNEINDLRRNLYDWEPGSSNLKSDWQRYAACLFYWSQNKPGKAMEDYRGRLAQPL